MNDIKDNVENSEIDLNFEEFDNFLNSSEIGDIFGETDDNVLVDPFVEGLSDNKNVEETNNVPVDNLVADNINEFSLNEVQEPYFEDQNVLSNDMVEPVSEEVVLSNDMIEPVSEEVVLSNDMIEPVSEEVVLSNDMIEPVSEEVVLSNDMIEPVSEEVVLSNEFVEPVSEEVVLSNDMIEPVSEEVVLSNEFVEPVSDEVVSEVAFEASREDVILDEFETESVAPSMHEEVSDFEPFDQANFEVVDNSVSVSENLVVDGINQNDGLGEGLAPFSVSLSNNLKYLKEYSGNLTDKVFEYGKFSQSAEFVGTDDCNTIHVNVGYDTYGWNVKFSDGTVMSLRDVKEYQLRNGALPDSSGCIMYGQNVLTFEKVKRIVIYETVKYFSYGV